MPIKQVLTDQRIPVKIWTDEVDDNSKKQLSNIASLPFIHHHVAAMPDVHLGIGATIGSVIATHKAIIPAAVGVDIGCGMVACRLSITANDLDEKSLKGVFDQISRDVPVGRGMHNNRRSFEDQALPFATGLNRILEKHPVLEKTICGTTKWVKQLGTLGGGNHFIELCLDTEDNVWLMLHSGSRNIGKELAEVHMFKARKLEHNQALKDRDLAVFLAGTPEMTAYRRDLFWAQEYARLNRAVMLKLYMQVLEGFFPAITFEQAVYCHHNYVAEETHFGEELMVTRKGAIRAGLGELGIIPGSMGTKSYIVRGRGNPEAFESASHGAGRRMSRSKAKQKFTLEDFREQTEGVECRKDQGVLDEIPKAYKDIDKVMAMQQDLVEVVAELKQVLCVKG